MRLVFQGPDPGLVLHKYSMTGHTALWADLSAHSLCLGLEFSGEDTWSQSPPAEDLCTIDKEKQTIHVRFSVCL